MPAQIRLPANLRALAGDNASIEVGAESIGGALTELVKSYPDLRSKLLGDDGLLLSHVNLFKNGTNVRDLATIIGDEDEIVVLTALAGG